MIVAFVCGYVLGAISLLLIVGLWGPRGRIG